MKNKYIMWGTNNCSQLPEPTPVFQGVFSPQLEVLGVDWIPIDPFGLMAQSSQSGSSGACKVRRWDPDLLHACHNALGLDPILQQPHPNIPTQAGLHTETSAHLSTKHLLTWWAGKILWGDCLCTSVRNRTLDDPDETVAPELPLLLTQWQNSARLLSSI